MPRTHSSNHTRDRSGIGRDGVDPVLEDLATVFRLHGFEGASLSRLAEATSLGRASLYHRFPGGKDEMARAVLEYVGGRFESIVLAPLDGDGDPGGRLAAMGRGLKTFYEGGSMPCMLETLSIGAVDERVRAGVGGAFQRWIAALTAVLVEAGLPRAEAKRRAEDFVVRVEGALVVSRGLEAERLFTRVLKSIPGLLEPAAGRAARR